MSERFKFGSLGMSASFILTLLAFSFVPVMANSIQYCADNSVQNTTTDQFIYNGSTTTRFTFTSNTTCEDGCSKLLSACRPSQFNQSLILVGIIGLFVSIMIVSIYLSRDLPYLEVGVGITIAVIAFVIGLTDTFTAGYGYVLYALGVIFLVMSGLQFFSRRRG